MTDVLLAALVVVGLSVELDPEVEVGHEHKESNGPAFECHGVVTTEGREETDMELGCDGDGELKKKL